MYCALPKPARPNSASANHPDRAARCAMDGLLSRYQHARRIKRLGDRVIFEDAEAHAFDQLGYALFHLAAPERRRDFAEDAINRVEHGGVLADQDHGEI